MDKRYPMSGLPLTFLVPLMLTMVLAVPSPALAADGVTIWRLNNPYTGEHLFTTNRGEYDQRASEGWVGEGSGWEAPTSGTPVYRLYNPWTGEHHYTTSETEYSQLGSSHWEQEGTAFFSAPDTGKPVYRLFNPYAKVGTHHYSTSLNEYAKLGSAGWRQERVGWYALGDPDQLPKGWITVKGTLWKGTNYQWALDHGWTSRAEGWKNSPTAMTILEFDGPVEISTHAWQGLTNVWTTFAAEHIVLDDGLFTDYRPGQMVTLAINQDENGIPGDYFKAFGVFAYEVAILDASDGGQSGQTRPDTPSQPNEPSQPEVPSDGGVWYHLYNPYTGEHHYTQSQQESRALQDLGWTYMGTVAQPPQSTDTGSDQAPGIKVYKIHLPGTNGYVYTTDESILPGYLDGGDWVLESVYGSWEEVVFTPGAKYGVLTPDRKTYIYLDNENEWKIDLSQGCEDVGPGKGWA